MKKLPVGMQTFSELIEEGYLYVDKTRYIYDLFESGGKYYFLSRPRRFGKSLLVSTLKEIFSGNRELFKGLWIYDKIEWERHPVIHIDFSGLRYGSKEELSDTLDFLIESNARQHGITLQAKGYDKKCKELIAELARQNKVAFLVDEYDKPIIDYVDQTNIAGVNRDILRNFYAILKGSDEHIKFAFFTGVSKFSRVSVFSGLNNLDDITMDRQFSTILGYTEQELFHYFKDRMGSLAQKLGRSEDRLYENIKLWYNGYSWDGENFLYNPLSILLLFSKSSFGNYWFETATPTLLMKLIQTFKSPLGDLEHYETDDSIFESFDVERINPVSLFFQTGYLTIKEVKDISMTRKMYYLSYPNIEVQDSFLKHILAEISGRFSDETGRLIHQLVSKINEGHIEAFFEIIKSIFASIPYNIFPGDQESYYHSIVYLILALIGVEVKSEVQTNIGRIDAVIETRSTIFVFEFKIGSAEEALRQIKEKRYYERYLSSGKSIKVIGVGFDQKARNLSDYKIEEV